MFEEIGFIKNPISIGMIGGGKGSQIGYSHRNALARDGLFALKAGAFDINPENGRDFGVSINIDADRCYNDYQTLINEESKRNDGGRDDGIKALIIATPNNTHYPIAKMALENGLHLICEKPLAITLQQAEDLQRLATEKQAVVGVMYGYSGYVMVEQMRQMVRNGDIGDVRIVNMQFAHGYHASEVEHDDAGTKWRVTPEISGGSYVLGDIGTHCFQMGQYVAGLKVEKLLCIRQSFVKSRAPLEDNAHILLKYKNGAVGSLWTSAVNLGSAHGFKLRVIGDKGSIEWWDEHPNQITVANQDNIEKTYQHGHGYLHESAQYNRIGGGHPEGFFDSWANLYRRFGLHMAGIADKFDDGKRWFPSFNEGIEGVKFIEKAIASADNEQWVEFD